MAALRSPSFIFQTACACAMPEARPMSISCLQGSSCAPRAAESVLGISSSLSRSTTLSTLSRREEDRVDCHGGGGLGFSACAWTKVVDESKGRFSLADFSFKSSCSVLDSDGCCCGISGCTFDTQDDDEDDDDADCGAGTAD